MTIRDLPPQTIRAMQERCERLRKENLKKPHLLMTEEHKTIWEQAFSEGLKAGLSTIEPVETPQ